MTYKNKLYPWCIVRHLPNSQRRVVCRLRSHSDAEGHLQVLRRFMPTLNFIALRGTERTSVDPKREQGTGNRKKCPNLSWYCYTILFDIPPENDDPSTYSKIKI